EMILDDYGRTALIPYNTYYKEKQKKHKADAMHPANWTYDAANDQYICPDGREIRFKRYTDRRDKYGYTRSFKLYESADCSGCPLFNRCSKSDQPTNKRIQKNMNLEYFKARVRTQLSDEENRDVYRQRKVDIETVFGNLKANLSFRRFSLRGARKVKIETGLALLALNLRKFTRWLTTSLKKDMKNGASSFNRDEAPFSFDSKGLYVPAPFDFHMTIAFLESQVRVTVCKDCSDCKESKSGYSGNTEQHCQQIFAFNRSNKCPNTNNEDH